MPPFNHRQEIAALNNVFWYRAMFRAHGIADQLDDCAWWSTAAAPPFHANLVVLAPGRQQEVMAQLQLIEQARDPEGLSMKDSFANLDLTAAGYGVLFEASWIWKDMPPPLPPLPPAPAPHGWSTVRTPAELQAWEQAWAGDASNAGAWRNRRQFPASLLSNPDHRFLVRRKHGTLAAGGIANRSPGAVGVSNTFQVGADTFDDWTGLVQCIGQLFPGVPVVGYERGEALARARAAGFEPAGALRVWHRAGRTGAR